VLRVSVVMAAAVCDFAGFEYIPSELMAAKIMHLLYWHSKKLFTKIVDKTGAFYTNV